MWPNIVQQSQETTKLGEQATGLKTGGIEAAPDAPASYTTSRGFQKLIAAGEMKRYSINSTR